MDNISIVFKFTISFLDSCRGYVCCPPRRKVSTTLNKRCRTSRRGDYVISPRREKLATARKLCRRGEDMFSNMKALGKFLAAAMLYLRRGDTFSPQREDYAAAARLCFKKCMLSVSFTPRRRLSTTLWKAL